MEATFSPYVIAFAWIGLFLQLGTLLRAKIKILQNILCPSALIAGVLGFIAMNLGLVGVPTSYGWEPISPEVFSVITFHLFAFGFIGFGLMESGNDDNKGNKGAMRGSLLMCLGFCLLWVVQAGSGYVIFSAFANFFGYDVEPMIGYLIGAGFTQGPGQALAYGSMWQNNYGVSYAVSAGLAFSAIGFLVAGVIGAIFTYYGIKKGWGTDKESKGLSEEFLVGILDKHSCSSCACSTTHPANIDSFAYHFSVFFLIYGIAYAFGVAWSVYLPASMGALGISFLFFWTLGFGNIARMLFKAFDISHIIDQQTTKRITSFTVDFLFCSVFLGIMVSDILTMWLPFILTCIVGTIITLAICLFIGRRIADYGFERMIALFGLCTGSAASGLLLVRIVDPEFKTPAAIELGLFNMWSFLIIQPLAWAIPFAPAEGSPFVWILLGYIVVMPLLMFVLRLIKLKRVF